VNPHSRPSEQPVRAAVAERAPVKVGRLVPGSRPGALVVDFEGNAAGPLAARSVIALDDEMIGKALASRQSVVLLFENEDPGLPIIVGLLPSDPGASLLGSLLQQPPVAAPAPTPPTEARVDGKRVVLEGDQEVTLRCGDASITLRRDGKLVLRGAHIETTAKGLNRIRGGAVKIN
jgi:hypothetical protein